LWPDPADPLCPSAFSVTARALMTAWARDHLNITSRDSSERFNAINLNPSILEQPLELRRALLEFIADFANWDNSTVPAYLETSRALTQAAHEALGGEPGTRPLVVDPFAGGGSIPLEALRVGADAFASDLNPVAVLLNKVVLEYIPRYGQRLADEVRKWGQWIKEQAERELSEFYPKDPDGATPIAYLWARTIQCEGPGCGAEVPLIRSLWLAKKSNRSIALQLAPNPAANRVDFRIIAKLPSGWVDQADPQLRIAKPNFDGTVKRGAATCPCCGYTTPVARVREQLKTWNGGSNSARLMAKVLLSSFGDGRFFRLPSPNDLLIISKCSQELETRANISSEGCLVPGEDLDIRGIRHTWAMIYGISKQKYFFTNRQLLALSTLTRLVNEAGTELRRFHEDDFTAAVQTALALSLSKETDLTNSLCRWKPDAECPVNMMARQAIPMLWDFAEAVAISDSSGSWSSMVERTAYAIESAQISTQHTGQARQCSAARYDLPDDCGQIFLTDPPYYDAVPYAYLSDFFYVWLRRCLGGVHPDLFRDPVVPKDEEIVVDRPHELSNSTHDIAHYERELTKAFAEGRRVLRPDGIGTIVFASKTTASWQAILKAVIEGGWVITGSWPIDTEMETRVAAQGQARLASSVHLVCRPREHEDGSVRADAVGEWRAVLRELPTRIHTWLPRLASEGIVGADAIFACLGPALEIFSRYSRVERASGEVVTLDDYLKEIWTAVSNEALSMIFTDADTAELEADSRLTAMWLWTLIAPSGSSTPERAGEDDAAEEDDDEGADSVRKPAGGFILEYDAARKIAQGLGANLQTLRHVVEVKGKIARLLPVSERAKYLFGAADMKSSAKSARAGDMQLKLFAPEEIGWDEPGQRTFAEPKAGTTILDTVHQAMLLFSAGRTEALKRFLAESGAGKRSPFWKLAQSLSALYPAGSEEKRWVDGVLVRKRGFGF